MIIAESEKKHISRFEKDREAIALYLVDFLRTFAISLPGIFVPLFIFQYSNKPVLFGATALINNLIWVVVYYLIFSFSATVLNFCATNLIFRHIGFKRSMLLGMVFLMAGIAVLLGAGSQFSVILVAPVLFGISVHLFWIPFHIFFVRKSNAGGNFGNETALQIFVQGIAGSLGPLISGFMISMWGFQPVFVLTIFVLCLASVPAFLFVTESWHREHHTFSIVRSYLKTRATRNLGLAIGSRAGEAGLFEIFWPILLFTVLQDFAKVGAITAISFFLSSLVMIWAGKQFENHKGSRIFPTSVFINAALYIIRLFLLFPMGMYIIDIIDRMNGKIYTVGFSSTVYDATKEYGESDFTIYREIVSHIGQAIMLACTIALLLLLPDWKLIFIVCALCSLGSLPVYLASRKK